MRVLLAQEGDYVAEVAAGVLALHVGEDGVGG